MFTSTSRNVRMFSRPVGLSLLLSLAMAAQSFAAGYGQASAQREPSAVKVNLSEWKVQITPVRVPAGPVTVEVKNTGTIPHAFEIEGRGIEKSTPQIQPGATTTLVLNLTAGTYEG